MNIAVVFAGGIGLRFGDNVPKQFLKINKKPILIHTLEHFQNHPNIDKIYISTLSEYIDYVWELVKENNINKVCDIVRGGDCAMESIYNALLVAQEENDKNSIVLIHDGVRPVLNSEVIDNNINCTIKNGNAITVVPCCETMIASIDGNVADFVPIRKETFKAQAPQSFRLNEIIEAHKLARNSFGYENIVDNCTLFMKLNKKVYLTQGNFGNIKVTTPEDVYILKGILEYINKKGDE